MDKLWERFHDILAYHLIEFKNADGEIGFHLDTWMILAIILTYFIVRMILKSIEKVVTRSMDGTSKAKFNAVFKFIALFVYFIVSLFVLERTGLDLTTVLAASAAIFIGIGLALQDFLKDIVAGVTILLDKSVVINDIVEVEGKVAKVYEIKIRTTRAITRNDKILIIPNHLFLTETIYNYTQNDMSTREEVAVGVAYDSDAEVVKKVLLDCAAQQPEILSYPAPSVFFTDFADSSLNFSIFFYIKDAFVSPQIKSDLRFTINQAFNDNGISMPFPQREVTIKNEGLKN